MYFDHRHGVAGASFKIATIALVLSCSSAVFTAAASEQTFTDAYKAYQAALQQEDKQQIEETARNAFELAKTKYATDSLNYAALAMNYAKAIVDTTLPIERDEKQRQQATELYQLALNIYQKQYGDDAPELADVYLGLASAAYDKHDIKSFAYKAVEVADEDDDPLFQASVRMEAFDLLAASGNYTRQAQQVALKAYDIYQQHVPENNIARIKAEYRVAQIYKSLHKYDKAEAMFKDVINQFSVLKFSHPYALSAHLMLVELYEDEGQPDKATEHCQVIGQMRPWAENQQQVPLYRVEPKYPMHSGKAFPSGYVQVEFTVDPQGFVIEPQIVHSQGGHEIEKASLEALKKWRYAPKFENGVAVAAKSLVQLDFNVSYN